MITGDCRECGHDFPGHHDSCSRHRADGRETAPRTEDTKGQGDGVLPNTATTNADPEQ